MLMALQSLAAPPLAETAAYAVPSSDLAAFAVAVSETSFERLPESGEGKFIDGRAHFTSTYRRSGRRIFYSLELNLIPRLFLVLVLFYRKTEPSTNHCFSTLVLFIFALQQQLLV